jgi:hypothetical protein
LKDLRRDVERINLSSNKKTDEASPEAIAAGFVRQRILSEVCARVRPQSVLVVSGDSSGDARAAAATGCPVVSLEADPDRAARLYDEACEKGLAVLSLVMDFVKPTPSIGFSSHYSIAAHERLGCDLVWAPTLVDDLVLRKYLRFELAAEGLAQFSKRWLLVGFHGQPGSNAPLWYTLDNFTQALKKHFLIVEVIRLDSDPRVLVLCEKKQSA